MKIIKIVGILIAAIGFILFAFTMFSFATSGGAGGKMPFQFVIYFIIFGIGDAMYFGCKAIEKNRREKKFEKLVDKRLDE